MLLKLVTLILIRIVWIEDKLDDLRFKLLMREIRIACDDHIANKISTKTWHDRLHALMCYKTPV